MKKAASKSKPKGAAGMKGGANPFPSVSNKGRMGSSGGKTAFAGAAKAFGKKA